MKWQTVRRTLSIIRRLQQGAATKQELIDSWYVAGIESDEQEKQTQKALSRRFDHALGNARHALGVGISADSQHYYHLETIGDTLSLALSDEALHAIALLIETFGESDLLDEQFAPLLDYLKNNLTSDALQKLYRHSPRVQLDLRRLDRGVIDPHVREQLDFAQKKKRTVGFWYRSPRYGEKGTRWHEVEPQQIHFRKGHWILEAYCLHVENPMVWEGKDKWLHYRLDRINAQGFKVLRGSFTAKTNRKVYPIHYRLAPAIAQGSPSHFFDEMQFEMAADGWLDCFGRTTNLFEAERDLLAYGEQCVVVAPDVLVKKMRETVRMMAENWGLTIEK